MNTKNSLSQLDTMDRSDNRDPLDELEMEETSPPDVDAMLSLLTAEDAGQRMIAVRAFCEIKDDRSIPFLINLLTDVCPLVRVSCVYALGRNTSGTAVDPLMKLYHEEWNGYVRKGIIWALGNCQDIRSIPTLIHALKTDIPAVRLWSASGLAQFSRLSYELVISAIPPLIESLRRDSIAAIRSNCAWALGQFCRELPSNIVYATVVDALIECLVEDEDLGVKEDAKTALLRVGDPRALQLIEELELEGMI